MRDLIELKAEVAELQDLLSAAEANIVTLRRQRDENQNEIARLTGLLTMAEATKKGG